MTVVGVLSGAVVFLADLVRHMTVPVRLGFVGVSSYPGASTEPQTPRLTSDLSEDLAGRDVLLVDDILDTGRTLAALLERIRACRPASLRTCVLLRKRRPDCPGRPEVDFCGFDVPNEFVLGYGLDYDNRYRNLPDICALAASARPGQTQASRAPNGGDA